MHSSIIGLLWDFVIIISVMCWILDLASKVFPIVIVVLTGLIAIRAVGQGLGNPVSHVMRKAFRIGMPVASLMTFIILKGEGDLGKMSVPLGYLGGLILVLMGFLFHNTCFLLFSETLKGF